MKRENTAAPVPAEGTEMQQQARTEGTEPARAAPDGTPPPAERWVMATDHSALLPLIRPPRGWRVMTLVTLPLIGLGVIAYAAQMVDGLGLTGMSNRTPWSLYIANFVFFIGASAGGIVVASLAYALRLEQFKPVARLAEITALTCLTLATIFITLDVGRPDRLWHLLLYGNITSPLLWDVTSITIYGLLAFSLVYFSIRADVVRLSGIIPQRRRLYRALALGRTDLSPDALEKDHRRLHTLALLSVPGAIAVHTVTAWILGLVKTQPGWHTAILGPMFIVSAVVCGIALTIVAAVLSRWALGVRIGDDPIRSLARILFFALPVLGYLLFAELITSVYPKEPEGVHVFAEMAFGRWGLAFWFTLCGLLGGFVALAFARHLSVRSISYASAAVVLAVMVERWNIVVPALTTTTHLPYTMPGYTPTAVEIAITVAAYAGGVLAYLVLARILPMMDLTVEHEARP